MSTGAAAFEAPGWASALRAAWSQALRPIFAGAVFVAAAWLLWRQLEHLTWGALLGALAATPPGAVLFSIALTLGSYACLSGTELLALRALGHRLGYRDAARVALPAYALTNSAGFSPATGTLFRVQMYRRHGLDSRASALVALVAGAAVTLSGAAALGVLLLADPAGIGRAVHQPAWRAALLGGVLAAPAALWFWAFTARAPRLLGGGRPAALSVRARALGLLAGLGDWLFSSAALYVLLPDVTLAVFPAFLCAYIAGALLSAASGVPGGIGVFEAVVLALTALFSQAHETAAALLLYRCIYSLGPLAIWGVVILARRRRAQVVPPPGAAVEGAYWSRPAEELFRELATSPEGLSAHEAEARLQRIGPNLVQEQRVPPALSILLRQFRSPLVLILVFAGVIAGALQEWVDALIILAMVAGSTLLGFVQEHRASHAVEALRRRLGLSAQVRRGDQVIPVALTEIVPGDVVLLSAGSIVPADACVFAATNLLMAEAALTGESFPVEKRPGVVPAHCVPAARLNCVFMGSSVQSGTGEAVVVGTGRRTQFGEVVEQLKRRPVETDFARGVRRFGGLLIRVMVGTVLLVLIVNQLLGRPFIDSLLFSLALGLGMSPELLPAIISVTLSAGAMRLARKGVIVRQLEAIENLGGMTVFCTDKTGTLTEGEIRMVEAVDPDGAPSADVRRLGFLNAALETGVPNPLDAAVLADGRAAGLSVEGVRKLGEIPYDFTRKRLSVVVDDAAHPGQARMVLKGAVGNVLPLCAAVAGGAAETPMTAATQDRLQAFTEAKAAEGLRLLAVATRRTPAAPAYPPTLEHDLRLEGFLIFHDPPKPEAIGAIADLCAMGVAVKVLSGDNRHVVRHIAEKVGLGQAPMLAGEELARAPDTALPALADQTTLFAEVDPQQKARIVRALQRRGHAVGYLGDGINDAPALHAADVGVSVDQAVDVARESADVVLLRRDLGVLRDGVIGGRRTFANTLKYIGITTSANFGNMVSMALAAPLLPFLPMAAKQILLNNLLSDLPSVAISTDRVDPEMLTRSQRFDIHSVQRFMIVFGLISSIFDLAAFAVLLFVFHSSEARFQTAWFVLSLLTELAVVLSLRTHGPAWRSRPSGLLVAVSAAVALAALVLPFSGELAALFAFTPLPGPLLAALLALVCAYLATTEFVKLRFYRGLARKAAAAETPASTRPARASPAPAGRR